MFSFKFRSKILLLKRNSEHQKIDFQVKTKNNKAGTFSGRGRFTQGKGTTLTRYFEVCKQQSLWTTQPVTSFFECMKFIANLAKVS